MVFEENQDHILTSGCHQQQPGDEVPSGREFRCECVEDTDSSWFRAVDNTDIENERKKKKTVFRFSADNRSH